jgi:Protein of unknown function (DUF1638)
MRLKCIGCDALARPLYLCAATSPHIVDVVLLLRGLHNNPLDLRTRLQQEIDATPPEYEATVLAYGLCGGATAGLAARSVPVVVPRAHDCITVFLGGRARYQEEFDAHPGTYWYVQDYLERDDGTGGMALGVGIATDEDLQKTYEEYLRKYGKDNADYLIEMLGAFAAHYDRAALIDLGISDISAIEAKARAAAERRGWAFERVTGSLDLLRRLVGGEWEEDFLVLQPGEQLAMSYDDGVVVARVQEPAAG